MSETKFVARSLVCCVCGQSNITEVRRGLGFVEKPGTKTKTVRIPMLQAEIAHEDGRLCVSGPAAMFDPDMELGSVLVEPRWIRPTT